MCAVLNRPAVVRTNTRATDRLWLLEVEVDDIGAALQPGQFVHAQIPRMEDHILRRPFSVFYTSEDGSRLTILYQVVGFGSKHMTTLALGETLDLIGPVGHGWHAPEQAKRALLVAGGVGGAPLFMHAAELVARGVEVDVVLGAQTAEALVVEPKYTELLGHEPFIATDDGSRGHAGFCTDLVAQRVAETAYDYAACCGPEPMMRIVSDMTLGSGIDSYISFEKRMACGIGACLSCVVDTVDGRKRSCVDGPVFNAAEVVWS